MQFPIVREYKDDLLNQNTENRIYEEPFFIEAGEGSRVLAPRHAPFFAKSLKITTLKGEPLKYGVDWEIFRVMGRLTDLTAQKVACLIKFKRPDIVSGLMTYDTVGHFSLLDNSLLSLITAAMNDDRPVYWDNLTNKPVVFDPLLHGHSLLYEIMAFQDTLDLVGYIVQYLKDHQKGWIEIRVDHYYRLIKNYADVFGNMLRTHLDRHIGSYNPHALTAIQVLLEKVDNFATASPSQALQPRSDMKVTPAGLKAIVETYGYNAGDFLDAGVLPMSQFGNTNFIPPSIDGSFEGLGSKAETCAFALENDGSIVAVGNRLDGRNSGLYYSVIKDYKSDNASQSYSAYRYNHPKFIQDDANVDVVINGSNGEAMMVGDSISQKFYIGITNNTMNPAKHVYCQINVNRIMQALYSDWANRKYSDICYLSTIAVLGEWVYIFVSTGRSGVDETVEESYSSYTYKHFFRVKISDIRLLNPVTPEKVNMTFVDLDGVQWNNSPVWRWGSRVANAQRQTTRLVHNIAPYDDQSARVAYSQMAISTPNPNKPGKYALKFFCYYYCGLRSSGAYTYSDLEVSYEIDPVTNVMTMLSRIPARNINFNDPNSFADLTSTWSILITSDDRTGTIVLDDMTAISSGNLKQGGFPWYSKIIQPAGVINKFDFLSKVWHSLPIAKVITPFEAVVPPTKNNVSVRPPFVFPQGELFMSSRGDNSDALGLYFKSIGGKYASRSNVNNLFIPNVVSRALTNDIRLVNAISGMGGAMVSVPSSQLDTYGTEVGMASLCMAPQRRYMDRTRKGNAWTDSGGLDDIVLIDTCNFRFDADGTVSIVPTHEIVYPAAIVNQLKQQVESLASMNSSAKVWVTICDPTGQLTNRFGWLPVVVMVTYAERVNFSRRQTLMTIAPTYSNQGARSVVTGFTVLDKLHNLYEGSASGQLVRGWDDSWVTGNEENGGDVRYNQASQRCLYYLNGSNLDVYFDPGIQSGAFSNVVGVGGQFRYEDRATQRWTSSNTPSTQVNVPPFAVTPDNGITMTWPYAESTGGAAIIARGSVNNPLLASVYPETGWVVFFQAAIQAVFRGRTYTLPSGLVDLRDIDPAPQNKSFYVYAVLRDGTPVYEVTTQKRLESDYQLWVATAITNATQIVTVDRFNVLALDGHRISEVKRGNSIPASSGLVSEEGQIPWIYQREILP